MGGYYAKSSGETDEVAAAIREHYQPVQSGGAIPVTTAGRIVALADKLDSLAGIFAIGQKPTASKDPFALRRAALGVLRILIEGRLPLDLKALLQLSLTTQPAGQRDEAMLAELLEFVLERLPSYYEALPAEMFAAVRSLGVTQPLDFDARLQALRGFWALPAAKNLAAAHKRVRNILRQAGETDAAEADAGLFQHEAEKRLAARLAELARANAIASYAAKLENLASLREPVDAFFEKVVVNAEDAALRRNRLALLRQLDRLCREVADISCLPG
jgi:glycyl-tRNA synthetase beta chain